MKNIYWILGLGFVLSLSLNRCKDPLDNVELNVSTDVIKYSTMLQIEDGKGNVLRGVKVNVTGRDAEAIYNLAGLKSFAVVDGLLGLGVHPDYEPTPNRPVEFTVQLSKNGYLTQNVPVVVTSEQAPTIIKVNLLNLEDAPIGIAVNIESTSLVNNSTAEEVTLATTASNFAKQTVNVRLPRGLQFKDASGNIITGSNLSSTMVLLDPSKPDALSAFPGGSLRANTVIKGDGSSSVSSGVFNPAGAANIDFSVSGAEVRSFNQPIQVSLGLDPSFINLNTGTSLQTGDELGIYSYQVSTGEWRFEKSTIVTTVNGNLIANFETSHLTWYIVGNYQESCNEPLSLTLSGAWMQEGVDYPLTVQALIAGKVVAMVEASISSANNRIELPGVPASGLQIQVFDSNGEALADQEVNSSCGAGPVDIPTTAPTEDGPTVSLQLYVRCPLNGDIINVLPTFYLYYREAAPETDNSGYKLLGVVNNGLITTTKLVPGTMQYDFKAVWSEYTRIKYARTVQETNEGTVGDQPGDIVPSENDLDLVRQNCGGE